MPRTVALLTLGCARNEVDSEELAGRLLADGWKLVADPKDADAVLVNTCGFVDVAKKDSIDTLLATAELKGAEGPQAVVAVGCLSERYGSSLADELPEVDAVLGFDSYANISDRLSSVLAGEHVASHVPQDRRRLLPISPVARAAVAVDAEIPGWSPPVLRARLENGPVAPVKLASGCDRRCAFCAIPMFRGAFVSRPADEVLAEISWLAEQGVREVVLVSENSTSYGKDLGDLRALEELLRVIDARGRMPRIRVAYLQPAEIRPGLLAAIAGTPCVATAFDISFQHASQTVLRRMRRFGGREDFLALIDAIRELDPKAGIRSNVIVGFPGETEEDFAILIDFLERARLDAVGVFGYSDEEGTEAASLENKIPDDVIAKRVRLVQELVEILMAERASERVGDLGELLVESFEEDDELGRVAVGRCAHQNPDDGATLLRGADSSVNIGDVRTVRFVDSRGVDLIAEIA
jgi:ribosomal protein S12 methylthiotransferase